MPEVKFEDVLQHIPEPLRQVAVLIKDTLPLNVFVIEARLLRNDATGIEHEGMAVVQLGAGNDVANRVHVVLDGDYVVLIAFFHKGTSSNNAFRRPLAETLPEEIAAFIHQVMIPEDHAS